MASKPAGKGKKEIKELIVKVVGVHLSERARTVDELAQSVALDDNSSASGEVFDQRDTQV